MPSETIKCKDCPGSFEFTEGEQKFFAEKGFNKPTRCKACRAARKTKQDTTAHANPPGIKSVEWTNGGDVESASRGSRKHFRRNDRRTRGNPDDY